MAVVFLLGAGSSKSFGIPTTEDMAKEFLRAYPNKLLDEIFDKEKYSDIETLVKAVHQIKELKNNYGIDLLRAQGNPLPEVDTISDSFANTEIKLTKFIREKCLSPDIDKAVSYYKSLIDLSDIATVKIFTTNYDVIIEEVCHKLEKIYSDGFINEKHGYYKSFDPTALNQKNIQLYKIHGSVNWWADDTRQKIIKLSPDMDAGLRKYTNTMIYPAQKEDIFNYPFNLLQWFFGNTLNSSKKLIAIGHKFGDPNITATVKAALENPGFQLLIVNPSAIKIKKEIFDDHERVITYDLTFEDWLKDELDKIKKEIIEENKLIAAEKSKIKEETNKILESEKKINELQNKINELEQDSNKTELFTGRTNLSDFALGDSPLHFNLSDNAISRKTLPQICKKCGTHNYLAISNQCSSCGENLDDDIAGFA